jgi:uncharacterized membrane protein YvbJ
MRTKTAVKCENMHKNEKHREKGAQKNTTRKLQFLGSVGRTRLKHQTVVVAAATNIVLIFICIFVYCCAVVAPPKHLKNMHTFVGPTT